MPFYNTTPYNEVEIKVETGLSYTYNGTRYSVMLQYNDVSEIEGTMTVVYLRNHDDNDKIIRVEVGLYEYTYHEIQNDDYDNAYLDRECNNINTGIRWSGEGYAIVVDQQPSEPKRLLVGAKFGSTIVAIIEPDLVVLRNYSETLLYRIGNLENLPPHIYIEWRED